MPGSQMTPVLIGVEGPSFGGLFRPKNRGQTSGSRYIHKYSGWGFALLRSEGLNRPPTANPKIKSHTVYRPSASTTKNHPYHPYPHLGFFHGGSQSDSFFVFGLVVILVELPRMLSNLRKNPPGFLVGFPWWMMRFLRQKCGGKNSTQHPCHGESRKNSESKLSLGKFITSLNHGFHLEK